MHDPIQPKFGTPSIPEDLDDAPLPFAYPNVYEVQQTTGPQRLALAPAADHIGLLRALSDAVEGPYFILYVLVLSRVGDAKPGRYQSPQPVDAETLHAFLEQHRTFIEGDARHALWVHGTGDGSTLVYDRHNILYAYGPLDRFIEIAERRGLTRGTIHLPVPHAHSYNAAYDEHERRMISHWSWRYSPLRQEDHE